MAFRLKTNLPGQYPIDSAPLDEAIMSLKSLLDSFDGGNRVATDVGNVRLCDALRELQSKHDFDIIIWGGGSIEYDRERKRSFIYPLRHIPLTFDGQVSDFRSVIYIDGGVPTVELQYKFVASRHWDVIHEQRSEKERRGVQIYRLRWDTNSPKSFSKDGFVSGFLGIAEAIRKGQPPRRREGEWLSGCYLPKNGCARLGIYIPE